MVAFRLIRKKNKVKCSKYSVRVMRKNIVLKIVETHICFCE